MYLVINKCVTAVKVSYFSGHYLRNCSTLDIYVFWVISVQFNIRNTLPKFGTFLLGYPVYITSKIKALVTWGFFCIPLTPILLPIWSYSKLLKNCLQLYSCRSMEGYVLGCVSTLILLFIRSYSKLWFVKCMGSHNARTHGMYH